MTLAPSGEVRLLGLPVEVHRCASQHSEALRRELSLLEHTSDPDAAPARLQALSDELARRYGGLTVGQDERLAQAVIDQEETIDLAYELPLEVADACDDLGALLDELDQFCLEGDLLTLVTPPEALAYRRWFLGEFSSQLRERRPPQPWQPAKAVEVAAPTSASTSWADEVTIVVVEDLDLGFAPTLRDRILVHTEAGASRVVLDLSGCEFLDSAGVSLLLTTRMRLGSVGGELRIIGAHGQVAKALQISGVSEVLLGSDPDA
ncbi:MAG: STAS domain-containing protein [Acidimicrobiales bacterium]|nr:STAS domain-containing protein [Acidimicrobiales bacterium]